MKVTFNRLGEYTEIFAHILKGLDIPFKKPKVITTETVEIGVKHSPEMMCIPYKITLGNLMETLDGDREINTIVMFDSCGTCRFKSYWTLYDHALKKAGYKVKIHVFKGKTIISDIKKLNSKLTTSKIVRVLWSAWKRVKEIEKRQLQMGKYPMKIGVIGEIYTVNEPKSNMDVVRKIREMNVFVYNYIPMSYFIKHGLKLANMPKEIEEEGLKYFKTGYKLGGHGFHSLLSLIDAKKNSFDGLLWLMPFSCMPESTLETIMKDLSNKYDMPLLVLKFDEASVEQLINTRIEAFIDTIKMRKGII